jgi:hypothetical protein
MQLLSIRVHMNQFFNRLLVLDFGGLWVRPNRTRPTKPTAVFMTFHGNVWAITS